MSEIAGIPQAASGVALVNHINDRLRRINQGLADAAGVPGTPGTSGAEGRPGPASQIVVTDYGALGTGSAHDDTTAIQSAFAAAMATSATTAAARGHIHFPAPVGGFYTVSANVFPAGGSNLWITAAPGTEIRFAPGAVDTPYTSWPDFGLDSIFRLVGAKNVTFAGLTVNGNLSNRTAHAGSESENSGILLAGCSNISILNCLVKEGMTDGVFVGPDASANPCTNILIESDVFIENCRRNNISGTGQIGLTIKATCAGAGTIQGIAPMSGIDIEPDNPLTPSRDVKILGATITGSAGTFAVSCAGLGTAGLTVADCSIHDNAGAGINFDSAVTGVAYATGTVAATHGGTAIVGTGTAWLADMAGNGWISINGYPYQIAAWTDATHMTLAAPFAQATASGLPYSVTYGQNTDASLSGGAIYNNGGVGVRVVGKNLSTMADVRVRNNVAGLQTYLSDGLKVDGVLFDGNINEGIGVGSGTPSYDTSLGFLNLFIRGCDFIQNFSAEGLANGAAGWSVIASPATGNAQLELSGCTFEGRHDPVDATSPQSVNVTAACLYRPDGNTAFLMANPLNQFGLFANGNGRNWNYDLQGVYAKGTVAATTGSGAVVGTGTVWTSSMVGATMYFDGFVGTISVFTDATHVTVTPVFTPTTGSGFTYLLLGFGPYQQFAGTNIASPETTVCTQATFPVLSGLFPGFIYVSDYAHTIYWDGTTPSFTDGGSDYYVIGQHQSGTFGWAECQGQTVSYLKPDGTLGSKTLPNRSGAGWTAAFLEAGLFSDGDVGPAAPGISVGLTFSNSPGKLGTDFSAVTGTPTASGSANTDATPPGFQSRLWYRQ